MQRTIYNDGVEVDQSDLSNTEDTKSQEILNTRLALSHFGVINGLDMSLVGSSQLVVAPGELQFPNGEILTITNSLTTTSIPLTDHVSTFVGIRAIEVMSDPRPHETLAITLNSRAQLVPQIDIFPAASATDADRSAALTQALSAQTNDGNFVLLGEIVGVGTGLTIVQNTPHPVTAGGAYPFSNVTRNQAQLTGIQNLYTPDESTQRPIMSAIDTYHRSLIGSAVPTPKNPHGLTVEDLGGDSQLTAHLITEHSNGILGFEPPNTLFSPDLGSLAFSVVGGFSPQVIVKGVQINELVIINGHTFDNSAITDTAISFAGKPAGLYYIIAKYGTDTPVSIQAVPKATIDGIAVDPVNGNPVTINEIREFSSVSGSLEKKYLAIGIVRWDGSNFATFDNQSFTIPWYRQFIPFQNSGSTIPLSAAVNIPLGTYRIDLRGFGSITSAQVHLRSIDAGAIWPLPAYEYVFRKHAGLDSNGNVVLGQGLRASAANTTAGDDTVLKHLTDLDAWYLFGHRGSGGTANHALVQSDITNPGNKAGFMSALDKWILDNFNMTILKWADVKDLTAGDGAKLIADAVGVSHSTATGIQYVFATAGFLRNAAVHIGALPTGNRSVTVLVQVGNTQTSIAQFTSSSPSTQITNINIHVPAGTLIGIVESFGGTAPPPNTTGGYGYNLSVTMEYHYSIL